MKPTRILAFGSMATLCSAVAVSSQAQAQNNQRVALEEVVVTAQKREQSLQDTPISLVAFDAGELNAKGIFNLQDLQASVPNLQFTPHPNSSTTPRIFLRGVGNNDDQMTQDPSIAIYLDGVYLARSQGLSLDVADIQRIEVLRGPQGTLYGRNATGGAINFVSEAPSLDGFGFEQNLTIGRRDLLRSKTSVNIPAGERFAAKLSYLKAEQDGFIDNAGTGSDHFGTRDREAYMADFLWRPTDRLELRYTYDRSEIGDSPSYIALAPTGSDTGPRPSKSSPFVRDLQDNDITAQGHALTATWDVAENLTVKSISAYRELEQFTYQDYLTGAFGPFPLILTTFDAEQEQFSQEFQVLGQAFDRRLEYIVGLYYFEEDGDSFDRSRIPVQAAQSERLITFENKAYAIFGEATWTPPVLEDRLHVTVGARWSKDERAATLRQWAGPLGGPVAAVPGVGDGDNEFTDFSPSLVVAYDLTDTVNLYGKVIQGYKTGGFNVRASSISRFNDGFDEEELTSYEVGAKSQWWDNRLRVNLAVFRADYEDIQVNVQTDTSNPSITDVLNAGEATIQGAELDITAALAPGLDLNLRYGYLDAGYDQIETAAGVDVTDQYGYINAPRHSYMADLNYEFPPLPFGVFAASVSYSWQDEKITSSTRHFGEFFGIDDYGLLSARLSLSDVPLPAGDLEVALWGRNLEDKEYYLAHFNAGQPAGFYGEPRTYGVDFTYRY